MILDRVSKGLFGVTWGVSGANTYQTAQEWGRGLDTLRKPDAVDKPYAQVGPFFRCVSVRARDAASVPLEFFKVDGNGEPSDKPVDNHPISQIWRKPNGYMSGNQLWIGSRISKMVFGEWIWWYPDLRVGSAGGLKATQGARGEIQLLYPPAVKRKLSDDGTLSYALRQRDGSELPLDPDTVTHSRAYNPYSQSLGLALASPILADLIGFHAAAQWNARFFNEQNGVPTLLLVPESGQLSIHNPEDRETFLRRFTQRHSGQRRVGILPGGWDVKDFGFTQRDMDFFKLRTFDRDEILAACGTPPLIAGYLNAATTYNADEQKQVYWESTITDDVEEEVAVINGDFLPKIGVSERLYPNWDQVKALLENLVEKTDTAVKWFDMGLSKKVINDRLDMGWDEADIEDYDVGYLPINLIPSDSIDLLMAPPVVSETTEPVGGGDDQDAPEKSLAGPDDLHRTLFWRRLMRQTLDLEHRMNGVIRRHVQEIRSEVLSNVEGTKGWLVSHHKQDDADVTDFLGALFDILRSKERISRAARPLHREAIRRGGESIMLEVGAQIDFDMQDPVVLARLQQLTRQITRIDDTIEARLRKQLADGLAAGESPQQLAKRVRHAMDASLGRSMVIARTETGFAFSEGRHQAMKQAGVEHHEWLTSRDARVRKSHKIDGQVRRIGEPFSNGLTRPLQQGAAADEVVNCRCTVVPRLIAEGE